MEPTSNCTVPLSAGDTVAVRVTDVPTIWGVLGVVDNVVCVEVNVGAGYTTCQVEPVTSMSAAS